MDPFDPKTHPDGGTTRHAEASDRLAQAALPTWELEEWRYSPIADLDLSAFGLAEAAESIGEQELAQILESLDVGVELGDAANVVLTRNGRVVHSQGSLVEVIDTAAGAGDRSRVDSNQDPFADMSEVFGAETVVVTTRPGQMVDDEVTLVHLIDADAVVCFPRLQVEAADASAVNVSEIYSSGDVEALLVPHVEVRCGDAANVGYVMRQHLGPRVWQIGSQVSEVAQQATFRSSLAAFGGQYARLRSDCRLRGRGAHGDLDAIYFGDGDQVLDFRTFQDHDAPDTTSNLLFKGVVDDASRAIYTGLIRVAETAPGTTAYQTNRNIKLGPESWAESVPNLEIETDDVRCSHASTVGPVDDEQRFYLETRGVPPQVADQLIVAGFFDEVIADLPVRSAETAIRQAVDAKLMGAR